MEPPPLTTYAQLVLGPPGSGKTTYCKGMAEYLRGLGRYVSGSWVGDRAMGRSGVYEGWGRVSIDGGRVVGSVLASRKGDRGGVEREVAWVRLCQGRQLTDTPSSMPCPGTAVYGNSTLPALPALLALVMWLLSPSSPPPQGCSHHQPRPRGAVHPVRRHH